MGRQRTSRVLLNADAVWDLLNRLNMSQGDLAKAARISPGYLSQLLSGQRCPSPRVRACLQVALGVRRFDELFVIEKNIE